MAVVTTPLVEAAETIFTDLGYVVTEDGSELRAERKWRVVYVSTADPAEASERGDLRCFVARAEDAPSVRDRLLQLAPDYDWAVMGVEEDGSYSIIHPTESEGLPT